jgi:hypothetical protein
VAAGWRANPLVPSSQQVTGQRQGTVHYMRWRAWRFERIVIDSTSARPACASMGGSGGRCQVKRMDRPIAMQAIDTQGLSRSPAAGVGGLGRGAGARGGFRGAPAERWGMG